MIKRTFTALLFGLLCNFACAQVSFDFENFLTRIEAYFNDANYSVKRYAPLSVQLVYLPDYVYENKEPWTGLSEVRNLAVSLDMKERYALEVVLWDKLTKRFVYFIFGIADFRFIGEIAEAPRANALSKIEDPHLAVGKDGVMDAFKIFLKKIKSNADKGESVAINRVFFGEAPISGRTAHKLYGTSSLDVNWKLRKGKIIALTDSSSDKASMRSTSINSSEVYFRGWHR